MSYLKSAFLSLFCLATLCGFGQAPPLFGWQKCLGGSSIDASQKVLTCANSDHLIIGNTQSVNGDIVSNHGSRDYWVIRVNSSGVLQWTMTYGGTGSDIATSACELSDGSFLVCGYTSSNNGDVTGNHGNFDVWLVKISATGTKLWQRTFGGTNNDFAESVCATPDGGFIIGGSSYSNNGNVSGNHGDQDFWILKTDSTGILQWQKSIGGAGFEQCFSILLMADGSYIAVGVRDSTNANLSGSHGMNDCMVVHLDTTGNILWSYLYGGSANESAFNCIENASGNIVVAGYSNSSNGDVVVNRGSSDVWVFELDPNGSLLNSKTYGGSNSDIGYSIGQNAAGYLIASSTFSMDMDIALNHGGEDVFMIQTDFSGNIIWTKTYGGTSGDHPASFVGNYDDGFVVCGYSYSNNGDVSGNHGNSDVWVCDLDCVTPNMAFINPQDSMCINSTAAFTNASVNASQFEWRINGTNISGTQNLSFTFDSTGDFLVELVGNTCLMTNTFSKNIKISDYPNPAVTASGTMICNNDSILLQASTAETYTWSHGASTQSVWITAAGTYDVTLSNGGCAASSAPVSITSHSMPVFNFGNDTAFCSGSNFWITAPTGYASYTWQDGSTYRSFVATLPGIYTITVSDGICNFTESIEVDTTNCNLLTANFTANHISVCQNETVDFSDLSSNATSWLWSFPGGTPSTSTLRNPTGIVYSNPGNYDVSLIASNSNGNNANFRQNFITVNALPAKPSVTATGTILLSTQAPSYQWYLDSMPVSGANSAAYLAVQSGSYAVLVTSPEGCTRMSDPFYISITGVSTLEPSEVFFQVFPNPASGLISLKFNNSTTGIYQLDILNIAGQLVYADQIIANNKTPETISLSHLPAGFYMIHAHNDSEFFVSRIQLIR